MYPGENKFYRFKANSKKGINLTKDIKNDLDLLLS